MDENGNDTNVDDGMSTTTTPIAESTTDIDTNTAPDFLNIINTNRLELHPISSTYATCHLVSLLPFSLTDSNASGPVLNAHISALATFLAVNHLNQGNGSIVQDIDGLSSRCNIQFSMEYIDTFFNPGAAVTALIRRLDELLLYSNNTSNNMESFSNASATAGSVLRRRRPCAFLGAIRSIVSEPTSTITGLHNIPQVSGQSTSAELDNRIQFPRFARTIPSDEGTAEAAIHYLTEELGIQYLVVINDNDSYGNAYASELRNAAIDTNLRIQQIPLDRDGKNIVQAVAAIKMTQYRYIYVIRAYDVNSQFAFMEEAYQQGIAGTGKHTWVFSDGFRNVLNGKTFERGSTLHHAFRGSGMILASGSKPDNPVFDSLVQQMKMLQNSTEHMDYLISLLPTDTGSLLREETIFDLPIVLDVAPFVYEATVLVGLAACGATNADLFLGGDAFYNRLLQTSFLGISGNVILDEVTGTRIPNSSHFRMVNFIEQDANSDLFENANLSNKIYFEKVTTSIFHQGKWEHLQSFIYNDGSIDRPPDLPQVRLDSNDINTEIRVFALLFYALSVLLALACAIWTYWNRDTPIVRASQPVFLVLICCGSIILSSTIVPLTFDTSDMSIDSLTASCTASIWLVCLGFAVIYSSLGSKAYRINKIIQSSKACRRIQIRVRDTLIPMTIVLLLNIIILSLMTAMNPIEYEIVEVFSDFFGRPEETYGRCRFGNEHMEFLIPLLVLNFGILCLALFQAYRSRNLSTKFQESQYIFRALVTMILVNFIGLPVLVIARDNPDASVFLISAIIFVTCFSIQILIFIPKVLYEKRRRSKSEEASKGDHSRVKVSGLNQNYITDSFDRPTNNSEESSGYGDRIISTKTRDELADEVNTLKRRVRSLEDKLNLPPGGDLTTSSIQAPDTNGL